MERRRLPMDNLLPLHWESAHRCTWGVHTWVTQRHKVRDAKRFRCFDLYGRSGMSDNAVRHPIASSDCQSTTKQPYQCKSQRLTEISRLP